MNEIPSIPHRPVSGEKSRPPARTPIRTMRPEVGCLEERRVLRSQWVLFIYHLCLLKYLFSSWIFRHCRIRLSSSISKCIISHRRSTPLQSRSNDLARRICFSSHPHRRNSNRLSKTLQVQHEPHQGQVHMDEFKDLAIGKNRNCRTRLNRRPSQPLRLPPR